MKSDFRNIFFRNQILDITARDFPLANKFKNFYRGQLFNFCFRFSPQNFTPRDAKKTKQKNQNINQISTTQHYIDQISTAKVP